MVYTITMNPALDYVMKTENLRSDDINRTLSEEIFYGGKGINVSAILTKLGIETTAFGFLGGFTGQKIEEMLKSEHINCDFNYLSSGNTRINVKIKADKEIDINATGPTVTETEIQELLKKTDSICNGDYLVLAGSIPNSIPNDIYERILERLKEKNVNCVVDTTGELLKNVLKYKPFLIKPNHHELGDLFGVKITTEEEIIKYAKELQKSGAQNVLVSCASNGAMLIDKNGFCRKVENAEGKLVNSAGCGDSMVAGFIAGYIAKNDYLYALSLGSACGNATAFSEGLASKEEIDRVLSLNLKITDYN